MAKDTTLGIKSKLWQVLLKEEIRSLNRMLENIQCRSYLVENEKTFQTSLEES